MAEENDEVLVSDKEEDETRPGPSKRAKSATGAGKYHTRFHCEWTKIWPFIVEISDNPFMFQCTLCLRRVSCEHMGKADVERHISTPMHVSNAKATKSQSTLTFHSVSTPIDEKANQLIYINININI